MNPSSSRSATAALIDVACSCDDRFAQHAAVVIASAVATARDPSLLRFWILTAGLSPANQQILISTAERGQAQLQIVTVTADEIEIFKNIPIPPRISLAAYFRLLLPALLPNDIHQLIYLDADVVVQKDLADLADIDLGSHLVGAVTNPRFARWDILKLDPGAGYFNSGIMVVNLRAWRDEKLSEKLCRIAATEGAILKLWDQDALNIAIAGRWLRLDPRWNQQYSFHLIPAEMLGLTGAEHARLLREPYIVHYSGSNKPWCFVDDHPLKHLYYRYLQRTPLAGWRPKPRETKDWMRKLARFFVPHRFRETIFGGIRRRLGRSLPISTTPVSPGM